MAVFSSIVIPLLTLIVAILALILDYLEYDDSKKSQHEGNPDKYINSKKHHIIGFAGEPPDHETCDVGKDEKKIQETDT